VESDPLGLAAGWNTYAYVGGDPVMRRDLFGLKDVYVFIWDSGFGEGHVMMTETNGTVITNQYPGKNRSWI
jgi:hypothetical protein